MNNLLNATALNHEYDKVIKISEKAKLIEEFRNKVVQVKEEWNKIIIGKPIIKNSKKHY